MAYTKEQISETVDYIAKQILDQSPTIIEFKDSLTLVLNSMTLDLPNKSRPKEIEISKYAFRNKDNPLNIFFNNCEAQGISFPPLLSVVLKRSGESIDCTAGDSFVVYENKAEFEEVDSYVDAFTFRKAQGTRKHDFLNKDKDCPRLIKPSVPDCSVQKVEEITPVSLKRKDEKEKFFRAQHRKADGYQVVDRRSKSKAAHKPQPKVYAPAYYQYKQVSSAELISLQVAFTQLQMSRTLGFKK